jgi:ABC-2 type transport system ATP-binding protein
MIDQGTEPALQARGLRKFFDGFAAVDGLDVAVGRGEVFGLVGPDGAGKTTTLRMICGALPPTEGSVVVAGFDVARRGDEVHRRIGYVPQRFSLYPELTVDENLLFRARAHGMSGKRFDERRESLLTFTRLGRFRRRLARDLSGGMRQKLALAAALLHEPEVLVLDEPTTGVDPVSRGEFWQMLLAMAEKGMTVMIATAYMDEAERCRRVGLLYRGRLLLQGTPQEIRLAANLTLLEVTCEPLPESRQAAQRVPGVRWVEMFGDRLHVAIDQAQTEGLIRESMTRAGVTVRSVRPIEPGMEDAFFELVRQREAGA